MPAADLGSSARRWLSPSGASPWRFDDAGETLVWRDGETVAFRAEVAEALRRTARNLEVVPPFPAVAVLVAAARAEGREVSSAHWDLVRDAMETAAPWLLARVAAVKEVAETASALRMLRHVPDEVFSRPDTLPFLVEAVFEGAGLPRDPTAAADFLRDLEAEPTPGTALSTEEETRRQATEWGEGLAALRRGLGRLDPTTLLRRVRTGLDRDVLPADVTWPDAVRVRGILAALRGDPDLGAVARLATDAMAAVRLPRPGATPEDLPIGGYADLANRGSPERLLISELAHDGLTLAVRIALREALYLRREAPPRAPHGTRCILLDSGIRLWGVGRVFATSVGLALAATSERGVSIRTWRAGGRCVEPVDLGSREGIDAHLEALRPEPHPAAALRPFFAECDSMSGGVESCVVTHANALDEPDVREALRAAGRVVHVVAVEASGDLTVHAFSTAGSQVLRTARLELKSLLAEGQRAPCRRPSLSIRDPSRDDATLPAILRLDRLPLRIPHAIPESEFREAPEFGVVARAPDRRLVLWTEDSTGPIELVDHTPPGALRDFTVTRHVIHLVSAGGQDVGTTWMRADLDGGTVERLRLPSIGKTPSGAVVLGTSGEAVGMVSGRQIHVVSAEAASRVAQVMQLPEGAWGIGGSLFRRPSVGAWALTWDGATAAFVAFPPERVNPAIAVFGRHGHDGPWTLLADPLRVVSVATGQAIELPALDAPDYRFERMSSSGNRLLFISRTTRRMALVTLDGDEPRVAPVEGRPELVMEPLVASLQVRNLRRHAKVIGRTVDGRLAIDGNALRLTSSGELRFEYDHARGSHTGVPRPFTRGHRPAKLPGRHWELREARWQDGSRAVADSRGMVHLVSGDPSIPEVTLVNRDGKIAGWSSDGVMYGDAYFLGDTPSVAAAEFLRRVGRFTERLR